MISFSKYLEIFSIRIVDEGQNSYDFKVTLKHITEYVNEISQYQVLSKNVLVSSSVSKDEMGERLTSLMQGHPPIWVRYVSMIEMFLVFPHYINHILFILKYQL